MNNSLIFFEKDLMRIQSRNGRLSKLAQNILNLLECRDTSGHKR